MANYTVNYNDKRFTDVKNQEQQALNNVNNTYNNMINNSDKYYNDMINAAEDYGQKQQEIQQANTDFAIEKIEQQKANTQKDYEKEQRGAYTDYARQVNPYGIQAESAATSGIARGSGVSESANVQAWAAYQGRIGQARDTYQRAVQEYDNGIKDAMLANNAKLAEIAYQSLSKKLELGLNQFQYKNTLLGQQLQMQQDINNQYYQRWQNVLQQINTENSLAEQIRQYNATMAENKRQFDVKMAEDKRQFNESLALQKKNLSSGGSGGSRRSSGGSGGKNKKYTISDENGTYLVDENGHVEQISETKPSGKKTSAYTKLTQKYKNLVAKAKTNLKGEDVLKQNSAFKNDKKAYSYYEKNFKGKKMTQTQLITALTNAQKNKKLNGSQITQILRAYGYNDPLTKYQKTITTPIKKTTKTNTTTKGSSSNRKYDIRTIAKNSLNRKR